VCSVEESHRRRRHEGKASNEATETARRWQDEGSERESERRKTETASKIEKSAPRNAEEEGAFRRSRANRRMDIYRRTTNQHQYGQWEDTREDRSGESSNRILSCRVSSRSKHTHTHRNGHALFGIRLQEPAPYRNAKATLPLPSSLSIVSHTVNHMTTQLSSFCF